MPIKFNCHKCGANLRVPEKHIGKKARCPKCDAKCLVPEVSQRGNSDIGLGANFEDIGGVLDQPPPATPVQLPPQQGVPAAAPLTPPMPPAMATPVTPPPVAPTPVAPPAALPSSIPPAGVSSPYASPMPPKSQGGGAISGSVMQPLYEARNMMKIWGWMTFIMGILYCLTIVGILGAWLLIWMGWLVKGAGEAVTIGVETGDKAQLRLANERLATFFKIMGVLAIISLAITAIYMLIFLFAIVVGLVGAASAA